jgi:hypothetical protein
MWFPLDTNHTDQQAVGKYILQIRYKNLVEAEMGKLVEVISCCLPLVACCLLPSELKVAAHSFHSHPNSAAKPKGIIIFNHGNLTSRFDLVHVIEHLVSFGWAVAAPSFGDSAFNDRTSYWRTGQPEAEYIVLCQHTVECVLAHMKGLFGEELPVGMIGFSFGNTVMRYSQSWDCPMVFVSGPFVSNDVKAMLPAYRGNAFLQFRGEPGELGVIDYANEQAEKHGIKTGPPWSETEAPGWTTVVTTSSSEPPIQSVKGKYTTVVVQDTSHVMWLHPQIYPIFGQFGVANGPGNRPKAAMAARNLELRAFLPVTIRSFFEEHLLGAKHVCYQV